MLGRIVLKYLKQQSEFKVFGTHHQPKSEELLFRVQNQATDFSMINNKVGPISVVINCVGLLRSNLATRAEFVSVNTNLPKYLELQTESQKYRLIHISSDAVFSNQAGVVDELSKTDPEDEYGITKLEGETTSKLALSIRTSIIGFDPSHRRGLIEWVRKNQNRSINGYTNQWWSGATVLELAELIQYIIDDEYFQKLRQVTNVLHFAPHDGLSKYELIKAIAESTAVKLPVKVLPVKAPITITRRLTSRYKKILPSDLFSASINEALRELMIFEQRE